MRGSENAWKGSENARQCSVLFTGPPPPGRLSGGPSTSTAAPRWLSVTAARIMDRREERGERREERGKSGERRAESGDEGKRAESGERGARNDWRAAQQRDSHLHDSICRELEPAHERVLPEHRGLACAGGGTRSQRPGGSVRMLLEVVIPPG